MKNSFYKLIRLRVFHFFPTQHNATKQAVMNIVSTLGQASSYRDRKYPSGLVQLEKDLESSTTLYLGNLSFYTTEGVSIDYANTKRVLLR